LRLTVLDRASAQRARMISARRCSMVMRRWANTRRGSWRVAGSAILSRTLPNAHWRDLGLVGFVESYGRVRAVW
jgi:RNA-directed DNA polymerase